MGDIITLREGEELIGEHKLRGLRIIVTNMRFMVIGRGHSSETPIADIVSYSLSRNITGWVFLGLGIFLLVLAFLVPSITTYYYDHSSCTEIGIIKQCPHSFGAAVSGTELFPFFLLASLPLIYYGYTHREKLEIVLRDGTAQVIRGSGLREITISLYKAGQSQR